MQRRKKLIIAILLVVLVGLLASIYGALNSGPDLTQADSDILILAADKYEQSNGGVDMAFMIHLENGSFKNYTPIYPGGMTHPSQPASSAIGGGKMYLHDCLYDDLDKGMDYAKEIVEYNTNFTPDAVVVVYDEGVDRVIDSIRPLEVDGVETNRTVTEQTVIQQPVSEVIAVGVGCEPLPPKDPVDELIITDRHIILPNGEVLTYKGTMQVVATAYSQFDKGCGMITATGTTVHIGSVAVDPRVIPLGTRMFIISNDGDYVYGIATAEDTGSSIKEAKIDLYYPSVEECLNFGRRNVTVFFLG